MLPMLAMCSAAIAPRVSRSRPLLILFLITLLWSASVQFIGAFAYNLRGWNNREVYVLTNKTGQTVHIVLDRDEAETVARDAGLTLHEGNMDVDKKQFRRRLWSLRDSQLLYYVTNFRQARRDKKQMIRSWLQPLENRRISDP